MRGHIEAIAGSQQDSTLSSCLAERAVVLSADQPGERGHAALRRNPAEYVAMVRHEALEEPEVLGGGFLGLAEHDGTFAATPCVSPRWRSCISSSMIWFRLINSQLLPFSLVYVLPVPRLEEYIT